jgi:hypothetical protein
MTTTYLRENAASLTNTAGNMDIHMEKTETKSLCFTLYKTHLTVDQRP